MEGALRRRMLQGMHAGPRRRPRERGHAEGGEQWNDGRNGKPTSPKIGRHRKLRPSKLDAAPLTGQEKNAEEISGFGGERESGEKDGSENRDFPPPPLNLRRNPAQ